MILTETRGSTPFPDLMPSAGAVMEAVQNLASVAHKCARETADEVFHFCFHCFVLRYIKPMLLYMREADDCGS